MKQILTILLCYISLSAIAQNTYQIAILKYNGGGDWYANPTALPNLIAFSNEQIGTNIMPEPATVEIGSKDIFNYPFLHMTGHGNVFFSDVGATMAAFLRLNGKLKGTNIFNDNNKLEKKCKT